LKKVESIREKIGIKVVFVSGNFNVLHPGHLRLLNFASQCGNYLVIGVSPNGSDGVYVDQTLRLESIKAIGIVDCAFIYNEQLEEVLNKLRPDFVVKGKEHEEDINLESKILDLYGGKLVFASGEIQFSSLDFLRKEISIFNKTDLLTPNEYIERHAIKKDRILEILRLFATKKIVVIGDLIVDEYIDCEPLGMSQEDPTIVVTPLTNNLFIGGAGIVAAHASSLGKESILVSVVGGDDISEYAKSQLIKNKVDTHFIVDKSRPTTLKQRYRSHGKTLLRVSKLRQHGINKDDAFKLLENVKTSLFDADLLIFSDFNYGCLPQDLVEEIISACKALDVPFVADSQSSSQMGDISRFKEALLITPTEREARLALRNIDLGLVSLAELMLHKTSARHLLITLGEEGVFIHSPKDEKSDLETDQIPALNTNPKDVSGAGDSLLTTSALALICGASIWEAAYLGSLAAACQVARVGNTPLSRDEIIKEIR
jgi:rfaE bifunctional protein kinase chain/domain